MSNRILTETGEPLKTEAGDYLVWLFEASAPAAIVVGRGAARIPGSQGDLITATTMRTTGLRAPAVAGERLTIAGGQP